MGIHKHFITAGQSEFAHSNSYARVASGERLGSTSYESFGQRRQLDSSRQIINGYHRSTIGNSYGVQRAKAVDVGLPTSAYAVNRRQSGSGQYDFSKHKPEPRHFAEPNFRSYNPYD